MTAGTGSWFTGRRLAAAAAAGFLLLVLAYAAKRWLSPFDDRRFESAAWRAAGPTDRAAMARSAIERHIKAGQSVQQVTAMLGEPKEVFQSRGQDWGGNPLRGTMTYSYYLGSWSDLGMDDAFLYVHFDDQMRVLNANIAFY